MISTARLQAPPKDIKRSITKNDLSFAFVDQPAETKALFTFVSNYKADLSQDLNERA
jgi:hypothetical protein